MPDLTGEDYDDYTDDEDWYDDDYEPEPDAEDYEIARAYAELAEHEEKAHGGAPCRCRVRPPALERLAWLLGDIAERFPAAWYRVRSAMRQPWTLRLLGAEMTVRLRPRECGACGGRGWFYSKTGIDPLPMPPGYDGVSLCGCGTAIGKLADSRRAVRKMRRELPF
jgi:hypothetical protein